MKASALFGAGWEDDSLEVLWQGPGRIFCRLWRDDTEGDKHAFVTLVGAEHPTLESNRLTHEHDLKDYLEGAWALRPVELVGQRGRLYQLVRQPGPISERQFEIEFLDSAVEAFAFTFG
jgi:hypothetical protein